MDIELPEDAFDAVNFGDLETRFGHDSAFEILKTLERFEGIPDTLVRKLPLQERLENVFRLMHENMKFQTRH